MTMKTVPIWQIEPFVPGTYLSYRQLKDSIIAHGIQNPPIVRETASGLYRVIDGRWRILAARACGYHEIQVCAVDMTEEEAEATRQMMSDAGYSTKGDRRRCAVALRSRFGFTDREIALTMKMSVATVRRLLK